MCSDETSEKKPQTWLEWLTTTLNGVAALVAAASAVATAAVALWNIIPEKKSNICQLSDGWIDYSYLPSQKLDTACGDGTGGIGKVVAKGAGQQIATSPICQFPSGWHAYPASAAIRVGSFCQDGFGHYGQVVTTGSGPKL